MAEMVPWFWIIGGPNGAGKTTIASVVLSAVAPSAKFLNADIIATELDPGAPERAAMQAGRLFLDRLSEELSARRPVVVESTLSSSRYVRLAQDLKGQGWCVGLIYVYLREAALSPHRIASRVSRGGHFVPTADAMRRYDRSLGLLRRHLDLADSWTIYDNSGSEPVLAARGAGMHTELLACDDRLAQVLTRSGVRP